MIIILLLKYFLELCLGFGCSLCDYMYLVNLIWWLFLLLVLNKGYMGFNFFSFIVMNVLCVEVLIIIMEYFAE